jgi:tetratricopeptide (TPR) repeat protein
MRHSRLNFGQGCSSSCVAVLLAVFVADVPATSCAQQPSTNLADHAFHCSVTDAGGRPLSGISLELRSAVPPLEQIRSLTNSDGTFTFEGLRAGEYVLTVAGGILLPPKHVQVNGESVATLSLQLPLAAPAVPGRDPGVISVHQLDVPPKAQEAMHKAYEAWIRDDFPQSLDFAQHALQLRPDYGPALALVGLLHLKLGHPTEAVPVLLQAVRQAPSSPGSYLVLASAYNQLHQNDDALQALSLASKLAPEDWQLHYEMGRAYVGEARFALALSEFEHAQRISGPDNPVIHLGKAHAMLGLGDYPGARDELETVARSSPNGPYAAESRELALVLDSHLKKAAPQRGTLAQVPIPTGIEH